jgi:AcrR family transcriptional regulator
MSAYTNGAATGPATGAATSPATGPRRRADAEQNRRRLLEVARKALEESGETTMQSIARTAGVGQGTLYRHFPTREALLLEVYRADFDSLLQAAYDVLRTQPPVEALRSWLDELAVFGRKKHALADVLDAATRDELHAEQYDRILDAIAALLDAGKRAGVLREDIRPDELLPLVSFLWQLDTRHDARVPHLLDIVVGGLAKPAVTAH